MSPVAIVDFEGSAEVGATTYPNVDVYRTETWQQSSAVLDAMINQDHGYKTVILDPVNALQVQLTDEIIRRQAQTQPGAKDRKSTRLNSSHVRISYAVFCLKKKNKTKHIY